MLSLLGFDLETILVTLKGIRKENSQHNRTLDSTNCYVFKGAFGEACQSSWTEG